MILGLRVRRFTIRSPFLTIYYSLLTRPYVSKKKYRIVYRLLGEDIEIIEIVGIGKREKEEIYKLLTRQSNS